MKRLSRDSWISIGLFLILAILTGIAAIQQSQEKHPPLALASSAPDGARALWLWLKEMGYPVSDEHVSQFHIPPGTGLTFMLEPTSPITSAEWQIIDNWIDEGGTLVIVGDQIEVASIFRHYDFPMNYHLNLPEPLTIQSPLMDSPPLMQPIEARAEAFFVPLNDRFVTHLAIEQGPVLISIERGAGRVILGTIPFALSNIGLKETGNPPLILNLIAAANQSGSIWFDQWHQGIRENTPEIFGLSNWLRQTPAGHALLYTALVIFIGLILGGRHFGRPVPLPSTLIRRTPLEYITAIANLSRRAGHRQAILNDYHHRLKRHLGQRYRLSATLNDREFVSKLADLRPDLDAAKLYELLNRLQRKATSETEMINLATEVAKWQEEF